MVAEKDYKTVVRDRVWHLRKVRPGLTLRRIAQKIPIQYTYLSRALRDPDTHLNEDHFFSLLQILEFLPEEIEVLCLQRSLATATLPSRRAYLESKLQHLIRSQELHVEFQAFQSNFLHQHLSYLFDPMCILVHVSLSIPAFLQNPLKLCPLLGISSEHLKRILGVLSGADFIELAGPTQVTKVLKDRIHYGPDHPLMRAHQALLRQWSAVRVNEAPESEKQSVMTTFTADPETFALIREHFRSFLQTIEKTAVRARPQHTYQLNFDLFKCF